MDQFTAQQILKVRDALVEKDIDEAYHQLYKIASPDFDKMCDEVWTQIESRASEEPAPPTPVEGPWKLEITNLKGREDCSEKCYLMNGKFSVRIDGGTEDDSLDQVVNLLNAHKIELWSDDPAPLIISHLEEQVKELTNILEDKLIGPEGDKYNASDAYHEIGRMLLGGQAGSVIESVQSLQDEVHELRARAVSAEQRAYTSDLKLEQSLKELQGRNGLRWVNATEGLPDKDGEYCIDWSGGYYVAEYSIGLKAFYVSSRGTYPALKVVRWLSDSPAPEQVDVDSMLSDAINKAKAFSESIPDGEDKQLAHHAFILGYAANVNGPNFREAINHIRGLCSLLQSGTSDQTAIGNALSFIESL